MSKDANWRIPRKTVYILGAGFSKLAGIPTISEFIPQAFQVLKKKNDQVKLKEFCELVNKYQIGAARVGLEQGNLETLFCLTDLSSDPETNTDKQRLTKIIITTILSKFKCKVKSEECKKCREECCVPRRHFFQSDTNLKSSPREKYGVCIYEAFLSYVLDGQKKKGVEDGMNAIITFNYDLVIESAVERLSGHQIYYGPDITITGDEVKKLFCSQPPDNPIGKLHYIKMHGSLNWISTRDNKVEVRQTVEQLLEDGEPTLNEEAGEFVPLVPPTWKRGAEREDVFSKMISETIRHMRRASRIIVLGYSLPNYDIYFKYIFAVALSTPEFPEIQIWDVRDEALMMPSIRHMFGDDNVEKKRVQYYKGGLQGFVTSHTHIPSVGKPQTPEVKGENT
jgi:hypothetical protein